MGKNAFAQGAAVVLPLSKYSLDAGEIISFQIHNQLKDELALKFEPKCEVDGAALSGKDCEKFFSVTLDAPINNGIINIVQSGSIQGKVSLVAKSISYALYKPLISPVLATGKKSEGLSFEFNYQPGYLYLLKPAEEKLAKINMNPKSSNDSKIAHFDVDLSSLQMPAVASISAKIIDKETRKMIRFVRLASDKILDPRRQKIELEGAYADLENKQQVCYEMLVQWVATKHLQKISDCG